MLKQARRLFLLGAGGSLGAVALAAAARARGSDTREVHLLSTYVAGAGYHDAPRRAPELRPGDALALRRRPESGYDARTVEVRTTDGALLGHVPRIDNQALANLMDAGFAVRTRVRSIVADAARPEIRLDVWLVMNA